MADIHQLACHLYSFSPPGLRSVFASGMGYLLRRHRYGRDAEALVEQALEREYWRPEAWRSWTEDRLAELLRHAAAHVPYYRNHWSERRRSGDCSPLEHLENWPVLEKQTIRDQPEAFLADGNRPSSLSHETTSGTTGAPIHLWFSARCEQLWYALCEARWRRWNGVSRQDRYGMLGAQLVTPISQEVPPFWVWNAPMRQLYLSAYHLRPEHLHLYLDALARYRVRYVWGHSASLHALAREALQSRPDTLRFKLALSTSEPLRPRQRDDIAAAFHCPVRETYGMAENVVGASECGHGTLHLWPDAGHVEFLCGRRSARPGEIADLVCTGLLNQAMPLIRYRVGDMATAPKPDLQCPCGRSLPAISPIEGRTSDMLRTADGRFISPSAAEMVFETDLPLAEAQLVQESLSRIRVRCVPGPGYSRHTEETIRSRIRERIGDLDVVFEEVGQIPRGAHGKFRAVLSLLPLADTRPTAERDAAHD